jgi:cytidylate kinase
MLIGICGKAGSGKDTIADHLVVNHGFQKYAFADPLKEIVKVFGFPERSLYGTQEDKLVPHSHWDISGRQCMEGMGEMF